MVELALYSISLETVFARNLKQYNLNDATMSFDQDHQNIGLQEENEIKSYLKLNGLIEPDSTLEQYKVTFKKRDLEGQETILLSVYYPNENSGNSALNTILYMTKEHHKIITLP